LLSSCNNNHSETFIIDDFSDSLMLKASFTPPEKRNVDKIEVRVEGHIEDTVKLGSYNLIPKVIDTVFTHEWYASEYSILFDPINDQNGKLEIEIEFIVF